MSDRREEMSGADDAAPFAELLEVVEHHRTATAKGRRERGLVDAPEFNLFDFLRDDETGLSRILAWTLNPNGSHGQGDVFLRRFLEHFGIDVGHDATETALVRVEAPTTLIAQRRRRIDVRVRIGGFTLAIENKPWAGWQGEQVRAYMSQLKEESRSGHCLVLVKGAPGELPASQLTRAERRAATSVGTLVDTDYVALHAWAATLPAICRAARVRTMLDDFAAHILRTFGDQPVSTTEEELARKLLDDEENRRTALHLLSASDALLEEIASRGDRHLDQALGGRWPRGQQRLHPHGRWSGHDIVLDSKAPFRFKVEFDGYQLADPGYGLWIPDGATTTAPYPVLRRDLEASGGHGGRPGRHWVWWRGADDGLFGLADASDAVAVWEAILSGEFAEMTVKAASRAQGDLRRAGVLPWGAKKRYRVN